MTDREKYIRDGLDRHAKELEKCYPDLTLFFLSVQGSQNYGLDLYTEDYKSDIDTKALVIPSLEDIVMNKKPISTTHVLPNNEHLDIKDVRLYFDNFKKQNINFIEILFSPFIVVNYDYVEEFEELRAGRELIAHYNTNQALRCMAGMSMEKKKALCHPYPSLIDKIEKYGYDGKQLHHIIRMFDFITAYALGQSYEKCLTFLPHKEEMMKAKLNEYSLDEALAKANMFDTLTNEVKNLNLLEKDVINKDALDLLNKIQYNVIRKKLTNELIPYTQPRC